MKTTKRKKRKRKNNTNQTSKNFQPNTFKEEKPSSIKWKRQSRRKEERSKWRKKVNEEKLIWQQEYTLTKNPKISKECIRTYGFIADPNKPVWKNIPSALKFMNTNMYLQSLYNLHCHNLCENLQPPLGFNILLGLSLDFCIEQKQPRPNVQHTLEKLKRSVQLKEWLKENGNDKKRCLADHLNCRTTYVQLTEEESTERVNRTRHTLLQLWLDHRKDLTNAENTYFQRNAKLNHRLPQFYITIKVPDFVQMGLLAELAEYLEGTCPRTVTASWPFVPTYVHTAIASWVIWGYVCPHSYTSWLLWPTFARTAAAVCPVQLAENWTVQSYVQGLKSSQAALQGTPYCKLHR